MFDVTDIELVHGEDEGGVRRRAAELADEVGDVSEGRWWRSRGPGPRPVFVRDTGDSFPRLDGIRPSLLAGLSVHPPVLRYLSPFFASLPRFSCLAMGDRAVGGCMPWPPFLASPTLVPLTITAIVTRLFTLRAAVNGAAAWS